MPQFSLSSLAEPRARGMVGIIITLLLVALTWIDPAILVRFDAAALDAQFRLRGERDPGNDILLVLVDEKSLAEVGRWPWGRDVQARLLDRLSSAGPKVIGIDVIYSESETDNPLHRWRALLESLQAQRGLPQESLRALESELMAAASDSRFADSLHAAGNVVLAVPFFIPESQEVASAMGDRPLTPSNLDRYTFMLVRQSGPRAGLSPYHATSLLHPLPALAGQAASLGHVYRLPDQDGTTRREVLAVEYGGNYYPSFALEIARIYLGFSREQMALSLGEGVWLGPALVETDHRFRTVINYAGRDQAFPWVSATDVLHGRVAPERIRGKAVLVGTAALGTYDQLSTPFSANYPGVEKNATVVDNLLRGEALSGGYWHGVLSVALVLVLGLGCSLVLPRLGAMHGATFAGALGFGYLGVAQFEFVVSRFVLPMAAPMATIGAVFLGTTVVSYALRERQAREIRAMFASYVSPKIVEELISSPGKARLGGERKELTMLFADLVGFTSFSEKRPAEEVVGQLNDYLAAMTEVIFRWNGTLDKFVGDEIVVFWGAPLEQPDHAELAVRCAVDMRRRLLALQDRWRAEGKPVLENGIGINTGTVVVGNIGAEGKKMDYTVIGDQVNLAARFQGLTRTLGQPILLTEHTARALDAAGRGGSGRTVSLRKLQAVTVRGRGEPVVAYTIDAGEKEWQGSMSRSIAG
ncbi:MAG: adenylate/guanylate cyclase domain-containing protein [Nitrospira sp.]